LHEEQKLLGPKLIIPHSTHGGTSKISKFRLKKDRRNPPTGFVPESEETDLSEVDESFLLNEVEVIDSKEKVFQYAIENSLAATKELVQRDFTDFVRYFWDCVSHDELHWNWHMDEIAIKLMELAKQVSIMKPKKFDLLINVPPGMTKSVLCTVMFPVWCWSPKNWPWMKFICASYGADLSLEQSDLSRDLMKSPKYKQMFPEIQIREDKNTKSNYKIQYLDGKGHMRNGGARFSTSVGGTVTGMHGHILIVDDPLKPDEAVSEKGLKTANSWMDQTLSMRKVDKEIVPTVVVMQRLHEDDPAGHMLAKKKANLYHICLPGELGEYEKYVKPPELVKKYKNGLLDERRLSRKALDESLVNLGQYGYAGQIGQNPVPPGGGMFQVEMFNIVDDKGHVTQTMRGWDKAGSEESGAYTVGVKMSRLTNGKFLIEDVKRKQAASLQREKMIRSTAEADGKDVIVLHEQEPGPIWEEELVQMGNGLQKKLKSIIPGDFVINKKGIPTRVTAVHKQGELPIFKITTDSGRIIHAAGTHPFLTPNGWVNASDLTVSNILALRTNIKTKSSANPLIEECRLAGYFVGDGCCTWQRNNTSCNSLITNSDPIEGEDIIYCANKLGFSVHVGGSKGWSYYISNGVRNWLRSCGLIGKNTFQKRIPDWVLTANKECLANFLGAYFACDGSANNTTQHPFIDYYSTNLDLLKDTQNALLRFGIYTMLRKRNYKSEVQKTRHACYRLVMRRSDGSMGRFAKYIPVYGKKSKKMDFKILNFSQSYLPDPIVSIEKVAPLPCRCLTVEDGESFIVNGVVVHNSGGKDSARATTLNLAGFNVIVVNPSKGDGDKIKRADPFSVQVNAGNVLLMRGEWNKDFINEVQIFPFGKYKDQVDAASLTFNKLSEKRMVRRIY
jgi:phage terminase large subunit-like protein